MKKIYFLLIILLGFGMCEAQYFSPGTQAQGHVENKNYTVDYSTGMFHYNIPLFTISSGGYSLPVSLSYTGKGRKAFDVPGLGGYNWDLIYGAVITRSIRSNPAYDEEQELDIFTLALNGATYYFIKKGESYEFLEKTNLQLKRGANDTWVVKDENGISYVFATQEVTRNAGQAEDISTNNVNVKEYISAWYVTEIRVPNGDNIYFEYTPSYYSRTLESKDSVNIEEACSTYYMYGSGMYFYQFHNGAGVSEAKDLINSTFNNLRMMGLNKMVDVRFEHIDLLSRNFLHFAVGEKDYEQYRRFIDSLNACDIEMQYRLLNFQSKLMGITMDYSGTPSVYQGLVDFINMYIRDFQRFPNDPNYQGAIFNLRMAKDLLRRSICSLETKPDNTQSLFSCYVVYTPRLRQIKCRDEKYFFEYSKTEKYTYLKDVRVNDIQGKQKWNVEFYTRTGNLDSLVWKGKDNKKIQDMAFSYYPTPIEGSCGMDEWGYFSTGEYYMDSVCQQFGKFFGRFAVNDTACCFGSLKTIVFPGGGDLLIDYEANRCSTGQGEKLFGGIRLKRLTSRDKNGNENLMEFRYPNGGKLVFDDYFNREEVRYSVSIVDYVFRNKVKYRGNVYAKAGNNGLYYDYVEEKTPGKGTRTYLFCVPSPSAQQIDHTYPFWLCGLPLAQASYDENGNLVHLQKNRYYTDLQVCEVNVNSNNWFTLARDSFLYNKNVDQKRISEHYLDPVKARKEYFEKNGTPCFFSDNLDGFNVWYDLAELYKHNVETRFGYRKYDSEYRLYYGGKTLLASNESFLFSGMLSATPSRGHLTGEIPAGGYLERKIEYMYDNGRLLNPTRVVQTSSNGDQLISCQRIPLGFASSVDPVMKQMIDSNFLNPVIKNMKLLKRYGSTDYILLSEQVTIYTDTLDENGRICFLPQKVFEYSAGQANINVASLANLDNSYYSVSDCPYREVSKVTYSREGDKFFPVKTEVKGASVVTLHDPKTELAFFSCQHENEKQFGGMLFNPWEGIPVEMVGDIYRFERDYMSLQLFKFLFENPGIGGYVPEKFLNFQKSQNMSTLLQFVNHVLEKSDYSEVKVLQQEMIAKNIVSEFVDTVSYYGIESSFFPEYDRFFEFPDMMNYLTGMTEQQYNLMFQIRECEWDISVTRGEVVIGPGNIQGKYKLITLLKPTAGSFSMNYKICQNGIENSRQLPATTVTVGKWQIISSEIDVNSVHGTFSVKVDVPLQGSGIKMVLLVPADAIFEASSFNADGTLFCKFDQNGQMERHEYDAAGRLIKTFDRHGHLLKENKYNVVNQ